MYRIALLVIVLAPLGCTNVNQMHKLYQEGDHAQLDRIMEIVSRQGLSLRHAAQGRAHSRRDRRSARRAGAENGASRLRPAHHA